MAIKASSGLKDFIRSKEGFKPTPYKDLDGRMAVGYGDTTGSMTTISEEEATQRLTDRIAEAEKTLSRFVTREDLTQEQQDVLLDMEYNIGMTKLRRQGFIDLVNGGDNDQIGRAILNYTRAKDAKTGQMKEFPGLKKRAQERAKMWGYTGRDAQPQDAQPQDAAHTGRGPAFSFRTYDSFTDIKVPTTVDAIYKGKTPAEPQDIPLATPGMQVIQDASTGGSRDPFADFSAFQPATSSISDFKDYKPKEVDPFSDFKEYQPQGKTPLDPAKTRSTDLSITGQAFDQAEVKSNREAKKLAKEEGIPFDEAQALIFEKTPNQVKLEKNQDMLSKYFPVATEWAAKMDNYEILRDKTKTVTKIETTARAVNPSFIEDMKSGFKSNIYTFDEAYTMFASTFGAMDTETTQRVINEIDRAKAKNNLVKYRVGGEKISESFSKLEETFGNAATSIGKLLDTTWNDIFNNREDVATNLKNSFDGSVESANSVIGTMVNMAENPQATLILGAQSSGSFLVSGAGALAGGATGLIAGGIPGATIGAKVGSGIGAGLLSFGTYMREQLEEFRNPYIAEKSYEYGDPGEISVRRAFSDPERVMKWRLQAATYGLTMGLIDSYFTSLAGDSLIKPVEGNSFLKKAITKVGALVEGTAVQAVGEGIGETGATIAALGVGGELTAKGVGESVGKGVGEAFGSIVPGAGMDVGGAVGKKALKRAVDWKTSGKESIAKTADKVKKSNDANSAYNSLQAIRGHIEEDKSILENPEALTDLINKATQKPIDEAVSQEPFNDNELDSAIQAEIKNIKESGNNGVVTIYPSDWNSFAGDAGLDPLDTILSFGPDIAQQYSANKGTDSSIEIPIGDWIIGTKDFREADAIARVNGNEYNAVEGGKIVADLEKDPFLYFDQSAFHGSPYKFDKFSTQKIGTGEGAQAFGYGLYFTEDKDIAEWYRKNLSERKSGKLKKDDKTLEFSPDGGYSPEALSEYFKPGEIVPGYANYQKVLQFVDKDGNWAVESIAVDKEGNVIPGERPRVHSTSPDSKAFIKTMESRGWKFEQEKGQTYEVDVPEKDQMLDWDGTFSEQSDYVKEKLADIIPRAAKVDQDIKWKSGESLYKLISRQEGGAKKASTFLRQAGIRGIKYAAKGGKSDKQNLVVFSDQDVSIKQTFYQQDGGTDQPEGEAFIPPVGDFSGEPVLRPVQLFDRFRNDSEKKIYRRILSQLRDATAWASQVPKDALEVVAELQFRHTKARADMLGKTIDEVANMSKIGMTSKTGNRGLFQRTSYYFGHPYRIAFSRTADASTLVHELGHSWLHEMSEDWVFISNMPEGTLDTRQREYKDIMEITAKHLGIGSMDQLYNMSEEDGKRMHETFAQTTEKYFLEGKFADSRVKKMLEYLRQWMTKIAHIIGNTYHEYPALKITPEVERIFNALLDADNKIQEELYPAFAEPMFPEGFLGKADQEKYLDIIQDARSEATAELYGKMLKAPLKEREAMINKALDEFNKEAEAEVEKLPAMRLLKDMETYYAQYKKKELDKDPRISFESFKKLLAEDRDTKAIELRATLSDKMISTKGKGGVDIEIVMQQMGITDPNEMLNLLKQAGQKEQLINERVNELIDKNILLLKTDKEIHDIAVESLNKLGKEKIIQKEFDILLDKYRPQIKVLIEKGMLPAGLLGSKEAKKVIQAKADELLLDSSIGGFNINRFLIDSDRHGRQAAKSFKEGNVVHVFEEKYKQSIQHQAYKKAVAVLNLAAETKVLLGAFEKTAMDPKKAKTYDIDVMTYGVQIINMFRNGATSLPPLDISAFSDRSGISEDSVELINKKLQDIAIGAKGRGGKATSVRTYLEFGSVLKTLMKIARDAKKVEIAGEVMDREQVIAALIAEVGPRLAQDSGLRVTEREAIQNILMGLRPVRSELASLFKTDADFEKSILGKIYNDITIAEAVRNEKLDIQRSKIINAVKDATKADATLAAIVRPITSFVGSTILNNPPKPVRMNNLKITLDNKAELYMFLLYLGSESGSEKLLRGGVKGSGPLAGYNIETNELDMAGVQADIDAIIADGTLTKKDFDMLQTVWDAFDAFHPDAAKSIRATDGRNLGYVKGKTVKTPWGDYRGGYIPITSDTYLKQQSLESMRSPDNAMYKSNDFYPNMDLTFSNTRDQKYYDVNLDFSRITAKLSGVANVAYLREPLMNIGKVLGSPDVMNAIEDRRPGFYESSLIPWFDRTKLQQYSEPSREFHNKFAKMIRSNANLKFYFGNVLSGLKQYIGLSNAIPLVGAKNLSFAAGRFVTAPKASKNFISSLDPRMKQMFESHHINQIKSFENLELNFDWVDTSKDKLNQMAFFILQSTQSHVSAIVWMAGYDKALKEGLTEKQAINFATNAVKNSQGSTTVSDMARVQFGTDAWKLFTMFSMIPITGGSEVYKSYMRTGDTKSAVANASLKFAAAIASGVFTVAVPTILEAIVSEYRKGEKEEDEEEKGKALLKEMAFNFADQTVSVYGRWIAKPLIYGQVSVSPLIDNVTQDFGAARRGYEASKVGAEITAREFSGMMNMITYATGLPFTILGKAVKMDEMSMDKKEATRKARKRRIVLKKAKDAEKRAKAKRKKD